MDRRTRNCIPFLGQTRAKLYSLFGIERSKTIPCPTAHPLIGHIREYPHPPSEIVFGADFVQCVIKGAKDNTSDNHYRLTTDY